MLKFKIYTILEIDAVNILDAREQLHKLRAIIRKNKAELKINEKESQQFNGEFSTFQELNDKSKQ